jgi:excisionase family DNA binding protein
LTEARCLTVAAVAARYNTTEKHVRGLVSRKMIPFRKFGGLLRFDEAALEEWTKPPQPATRESLLALEHELYPPGSESSPPYKGIDAERVEIDPEDAKRLNLGFEWWQQASESDLEAIADLLPKYVEAKIQEWRSNRDAGT